MPIYDPNCHTDESSLNPWQAALARSNAYALFGRLYLDGVTAELVPTVRAVQEFAPLLDEDANLDQAAADHYQLFSYSLFPFESFFLDDLGLLGGSIADAIVRYYRTAGHSYGTADCSPDHLGFELGLLAILCRRESDKLMFGSIPEAAGLRAKQREFLETHLLRWLLPLLVAVTQHGIRFYRILAELTLELVSDHYRTLTQELEAPSPHFKLPTPPILLEDDRTGLREIARYLATPSHSGIVLSRESVTKMARKLELPRGFGDRQQMWLNLARTAIQYGKLLDLLDDFDEHLAEWRTNYNQIASHYPALAAFAVPWIERVDRTALILLSIRDRTHLVA